MWDARAAANHVRLHAQIHSTNNCAMYVRKAIEAGGITISRTNSAKDYGYSLRQAGFVEVNDGGAPRAGDVVVIQAIPGHPHGHMAMYDGSHWVSDFVQNYGFYPGSAYRTAKPPYQIYRRH